MKSGDEIKYLFPAGGGLARRNCRLFHHYARPLLIGDVKPQLTHGTGLQVWLGVDLIFGPPFDIVQSLDRLQEPATASSAVVNQYSGNNHRSDA